ncbi:T6SS phospholipase effector Tle1-like catalytic domain-containing protein [Luteimonas terrae]|uniref:DUF2235 domain-containing protein n=1 Tax=Luteimonas terrae TaxID=1530191 RepID=A0A4R5U932_9GAMM|nr:DUF2235 domain-containing protein [Luteimonas terrae]TDK30995.1 DUF2235 domain-containing protein [Luteimonas terrae]
MGGLRQPDGVRADPATAEHLASFDAAQQALEEFTAPVLLDEGRTDQRLFVASFDGTGNSKDDPDKLTNIALIDEQIRQRAEQTEQELGYTPLGRGYVEGPGTQGGISGIADAIYGGSYAARLEDMYLQFVRQAKKWVDENPNADIRILSTGFSRGAEQAAGFTRLVEERGIQNPTNAVAKRNADGLIIGEVIYPNPPLREPGTVVQAVGLLDPVGTGAPRQHDRRLAESVISGFQINALHDRRNLFQGTWIIDPGTTPDGRFLNVSVAGAHTDIGGGYRRDGLGVLSGNLAIDYINALIQPSPLEKRALPDDPDQYVVHRSEEHAFFHRTSIYDRNGARGMQDLLAPPSLCQIDCRDAMPRNETMAASVPWRPVTIGPVQGVVPVRSEGLETQTFANGLLSAASRDDGIAVSGLMREQIDSGAGQSWLQSGFEVLERQSREFAERASAQSAPVMEGSAL